MTAEGTLIPRELVRGLLRREHDFLVDRGFFVGEHLELIEGELLRLEQQQPIDADAVHRALVTLLAQMPSGWTVRSKAPMAAGDRSQPQPDLAVVVNQSYREHHPTYALLVIEVSRSSLAIDLGVKARVYAAIGVPDYWVLDIVGGRLHAHRRPTADGYEQVTTHERGTLATAGHPLLTLDLDEVLRSEAGEVSMVSDTEQFYGNRRAPLNDVTAATMLDDDDAAVPSLSAAEGD